MERPADYSILAEQRLVAYLWRTEGGHLRRAGARGETPLAEIPYADLLVFDARELAALQATTSASADLDALLFKLGLDGFAVVSGQVEPHGRRRRF